jgi:hypothetical protein
MMKNGPTFLGGQKMKIVALAIMGCGFYPRGFVYEYRPWHQGTTKLRFGNRMAPPKRKWNRKKSRTYKGRGLRYYNTSARAKAKG